MNYYVTKLKPTEGYYGNFKYSIDVSIKTHSERLAQCEKYAVWLGEYYGNGAEYKHNIT